MNDLKNLNCLLPDTQALLKKMIEGCGFLDKYVLAGGTALALHLCHRKSEDLDFFTYGDGFDREEIFAYVGKFRNKEIVNQTDTQVDLLLDGVKVTFLDAKWAFLRPTKTQRFNLSSLDAISAMKTNVLFLRGKYRDYYDLYFIVKNSMGIKKVFENSLNILEGINFKLFATALIYIDDIDDENIEYLEPVECISKEEIRDFFQRRLKRLSSV